MLQFSACSSNSIERKFQSQFSSHLDHPYGLTHGSSGGDKRIYVSNQHSQAVCYFEEGGEVLYRGWCGTL